MFKAGFNIRLIILFKKIMHILLCLYFVENKRNKKSNMSKIVSFSSLFQVMLQSYIKVLEKQFICH